jgi:hypothetical protein
VAIYIISWRWPKIYKILKKDERQKRRVAAVIGGVKQSTVERIEGEAEEEKVELSGASCDIVTRTPRRSLQPYKIRVYETGTIPCHIQRN